MKKALAIFLSSIFVVAISAQNNRFDSILRYLNENGVYQYHQSEELLNELYEIAYNSPDSLKLLTYCISETVRLYSDHSIVDILRESEISNHSLRLDSVKYRKEKNILDYTLGLYNYGVGDYGEAFINALKALEQFRQLNDSIFISKSLNLLGMISDRVNQPHLYYKYFTEQLVFIKENSIEYFSAKQNQYTHLAQEGEIIQFIDSMEYLILQTRSILKEYQLISMYLNLSNAYLALDSLDAAYKYLVKSNEIMPQIDNNNLKIGFYAYFGDYMEVIGNYKTALDYYNIAYQLNRDEINGFHLRTIFYGLASCYEEIGETDSAILYLKKYREVSINEREQSRSIEVYQQYISNYLELTENQLIVTEQAVALREKQIVIMIISFVLGFLLLLSILILVNQQRRRKKAEAVAQKAELEAQQAKDEIQQAKIKEMHYQKKIDEAKKKEQQEQIEQKERELTSFSLLVAKNKEMAQDIFKLNKKIKNNEGDAADLTEKIDKLISDEQRTKNVWQDFMRHFEKVHPDFYRKLKKRAPQLTEENLRMCAYFKMGYTRKEISAICRITPQSVANQRARIKKKLRLSGEDDFDAFLKKL
ncbi:tetratricopeptide repeat protein [Bacteroidales bacterium OttesenSCG-928-J16]|nr:tetratricopeptide repeat protein [Bacteroidales bacterium OttesenSCG-928-J16]